MGRGQEVDMGGRKSCEAWGEVGMQLRQQVEKEKIETETVI